MAGGTDRRARDHDDLLTSGEVAELFGVSPRTVDRWEEAGKLEASRTLGGHRRFPASHVYGVLDHLDRDPRAAAET